MAMARACGKVIFLTGAPLANSLQWDDDVLSAPLEESFREHPKSPQVTPLSTHAGPVWRCLPMEQNQIYAGYVPPLGADQPDDEFDYVEDEIPLLSSTDLSTVSAEPHTDLSQSLLSTQQSEEEELRSQFYEESYAIHETQSASYITEHPSSNATTLSSSFEATQTPSHFNPPQYNARKELARTRLLTTPLTNLKTLPKATYLQSITPQTVTINLVVGIISILPPREITTRRDRRRTVNLVEILIGDDHRAGFVINIWLPNPYHLDTTDDLQNVVTTLRPRDIVLIRNCALTSFQGKVYGQSLRRGMTTIDLLYRDVVDATDVPGAYSAQELREMTGVGVGTETGEGAGAEAETETREGVGTETGTGTESSPVLKLTRVKQWVMNFVGASDTYLSTTDGEDLKGRRGRNQREKEIQLVALPLDTQ